MNLSGFVDGDTFLAYNDSWHGAGKRLNEEWI